jgi:F-type H+-transporting ATPase subunit delta
MSQLSEAYAQAFFDLAVEHQSLEDVVAIFSGIEEGLKNHPAFLSHPKLSFKDKENIFNAVTDHPLVLQFLKLLALQDRLDVFAEISQDLQQMLLKMKNVKTIHVYSKVALQETELKNIEALFQRQGAEKIDIQLHIDETLLGGIRLTYDDKVFDDSIEATYDTLQQMLN